MKIRQWLAIACVFALYRWRYRRLRQAGSDAACERLGRVGQGQVE